MQSSLHTVLGYPLNLPSYLLCGSTSLFLSLFLSHKHPRTLCVVLFSLFVDLRNLFAILARSKNVEKFMRSSLASTACSSFISTSYTLASATSCGSSSSARPWPRLIPLSVLLSHVACCFCVNLTWLCRDCLTTCHMAQAEATPCPAPHPLPLASYVLEGVTQNGSGSSCQGKKFHFDFLFFFAFINNIFTLRVCVWECVCVQVSLLHYSCHFFRSPSSSHTAPTGV